MINIIISQEGTKETAINLKEEVEKIKSIFPDAHITATISERIN